MKHPRITIDPEQMGGVPCIRGFRIPVATVMDMLAEGCDVQVILKNYPDLEPEDLKASMNYAADALRERSLPWVASQ